MTASAICRASHGFRFFALAIGIFLAGCASSQGTGSAVARAAKASEMFAERCKASGEKIYRTVEGVEGIFLLKIRPDNPNFDDQFELDDPYGHDSTGDRYILNFLRGFYHQRPSPPVPGAPPQVGYLYVEAIDPADGKRYRYTGQIKDVVHTSSVMVGGDGRTKFVSKDFVFDKVLAPGAPPRYGVTYEDISTREERQYWIAGSSLKVIDLHTNEVVAERVGYMMDTAQGSRAGARAPWLYAADNACPGFQRNPLRPLSKNFGGGSSAQPGQTLFFVEKVLRPTNGKQ